MADLNDVLQHLPLVLYLVFVATLSIRLLPRPPYSPKSLLFLLLSFFSLAATWKYMIQYMMRSYDDHRRLAGPEVAHNTTMWLEETSLFHQAWEYVCATAERWWISSQLCSFTVGLWTIFLFAEGSRRPEIQSKVWQYMLLGQIVAISFASSFFLALLALPSIAGKARPSFSISAPTRILEASVGIALTTVFFVPSTLFTRTFLPNLLGMHAIILLPLAQIAWNTSASSGATHTRHRMRHSRLPSISSALMEKASFKPLYLATSLVSLFLQLKHTYPLLGKIHSPYQAVAFFWTTVNSYPAQQSISWDVICTNCIWQLWALLEIWTFWNTGRATARQAALAAACIATTPIVGAATGIGSFLAMREDWLGRQRREAKHD